MGRLAPFLQRANQKPPPASQPAGNLLIPEVGAKTAKSYHSGPQLQGLTALAAWGTLNVSQVGSCKREVELQYLHGRNYFSLDVTAGNGERGKAAAAQIRRFIVLPACLCSTGRSSSSTQANVSGKDSKIHKDVCKGWLWHTPGHREHRQEAGWGQRGDQRWCSAGTQPSSTICHTNVIPHDRKLRARCTWKCHDKWLQCLQKASSGETFLPEIFQNCRSSWSPAQADSPDC